MSIPVLEPVSVKNQPIPIAPEFQLLMDESAVILKLDYLPDGRPSFFIRMDPSSTTKKKRTFGLFLSGMPLGPGYGNMTYWGSFIAKHPVAGDQVFHCFEKHEAPELAS